MRLKPFATLIILLLSCQSLKAQQGFYDLNTIQKIEIYFSQANWDYQLDTAKYGDEDYVMADWVKINGLQFDSVGVKYKGNSSYDSTYLKNPLHIELDAYTDHDYQGYADIKLGNGYSDPSMIREVLSYSILANYMVCPQSNFAQVYINGSYIGLYSNDESIAKRFCTKNFGSSKNTFFKCNPIVIPSPNTKSNLRYINADSSSYFNYYELKSKYGWNDLVSLCDTVTNFPNQLDNILDLDRFLWMLAFNNALVNLDSYTGAFAQNYYLYKDNNKQYNPIVWDLNMCLGGFPFVGSGNSSLAGLTVTNMQQMPIGIHSADNYWPLIKAIINDPGYKRKYVAHLRTIVDEFFANNAYQSLAAQLHSVADTAVLSDPNKFFTYTQFQNGLTTDYQVGSYTVPGINNLMTGRVNYLQSTAEFGYTEPVINNVVSLLIPSVNDTTIEVTARIENADASTVTIAYRFNADKVFVKQPMYDDGVHNDGLANDSIFGASINLDTIQCQYYIYAENSVAGKFSPARAEYEFYTVQVNIATAQAGQVFINEVLASNQNGVFNEFDEREDWLEMYNSTDKLLSLYGLFLSDSAEAPFRFAIPRNTFIQPKGYLTFWADGDSTDNTDLHMPFKISSSGENLFLSDSNGTVLDRIIFGPQRDDISFGRCPDGGAEWLKLPYPSYNNSNCFKVASNGKPTSSALTISPNPANDIITFTSGYDETLPVEIYTGTGQLLYKSNVTRVLEVNTHAWNNGMYMIRMGNIVNRFTIIHPEK